MAQDLACVVDLPRFAGSLGRVLHVQADEQANQLARTGLAPSRSGSSGRPMSHCAYRDAQSSSAPVDDPENTMVRLARLMQQGAYLLHCVRHPVPPAH